MKIVPFVAAVALTCWSCATNPATGKRQIILMSEQEEIQLGRQSDAEIRKQMGVYKDDALQKYVADVGAKLARAAHRPTLPWTFTVVDEQAVNAFALPGGFVYITRGILPFLRSEAELAAVMGHEVGHVDARHGAQAYSKQTLAGVGLAVGGLLVPQAQALQGVTSAALQLAFLKNGRSNELEADHLGVGYAATSGWDPRAVPSLLSTLGRLDEASGSSRGVPNWALTHPPADDRVEKVQAAVATAMSPTAIATNGPEFERHLDGLVFGDSREKGIVRGTEFLHPILRFAMKFPAQWEVSNGEAQVSARPAESTNAAMILQLSDGTGSVRDLAAAQMTRAGWTSVSGQGTSINGLEAYVGTYEGVMDNTRVTIQAAHVRSGQQVYVIAGVAPSPAFRGFESEFANAIRSFRPLSKEEADRIQPNRVDFYVVRAGDTWESLARSSGAVKASTLAIMNGSQLATPPMAGQRIRVVVGG
ncbi:MAG: M48 family metalloprotease [Acidobacteriota bacterium]